jgi:hypothetical protein
LGVALGHALARAKVGGPMTGRTPADLFRALGADEQVAVAVLDHQYGERISDGKDDNQ